jgi:cell division protein FtsL
MPSIPKGVSTTLLIALVVVLAVLPWTPLASDLFGLWLAATIILTAFIVLAGVALTRRLPGALIDSANTMSLSRLQAVLWTLLILPAFLAAGIWNVHQSRQPLPAKPGVTRLTAEKALDISIPPEIWGLLGISTVSLVGSPLIKNRKREQVAADRRGGVPEATQTTPAAQAVMAQEGKVPKGLLAENQAPVQARWSDLIRGEEIGNVHTLDLGKVQMLFFTVIVLTAYGTALAGAFAREVAAAGAVATFPDIDGGTLALLGISHAGYLAYKAAPQSAA